MTLTSEHAVEKNKNTFTVLMVFPWEQQSVSCLMDASIFITAAA